MLNKAQSALVLALSVIFGAVFAGSVAGAADPFTATDLAGASLVFLAFLAVGAAITIAMTLYRKGKQGAGKV